MTKPLNMVPTSPLGAVEVSPLQARGRYCKPFTLATVSPMGATGGGDAFSTGRVWSLPAQVPVFEYASQFTEWADDSSFWASRTGFPWIRKFQLVDGSWQLVVDKVVVSSFPGVLTPWRITVGRDGSVYMLVFRGIAFGEHESSLFKFDSNGDIVWEIDIGAVSSFQFQSVSLFDYGNLVYTTVYIDSFRSETGQPLVRARAWRTSDGANQWSVDIESSDTGIESAWSSRMPNGDLLTRTTIGSSIVLMRLNKSDGAIKWATPLNEFVDYGPFDVDPAGKIYLPRITPGNIGIVTVSPSGAILDDGPVGPLGPEIETIPRLMGISVDCYGRLVVGTQRTEIPGGIWVNLLLVSPKDRSVILFADTLNAPLSTNIGFYGYISLNNHWIRYSNWR